MEVEYLDGDMITMLPGSIIEMILTLMPIQDAVRTSVLSTKWRYNWTNIPKLVFDDNFFEGSSDREIFDAIYQILLQHHGPMFEFTLDMSKVENWFEIDQILLHLSKNNTLKKLTLNGLDGCDYLPSSFYMMRRLTHLNLVNCRLRPPKTFNGFSTLTSLYLEDVRIMVELLLRLVSSCPLKSFTLLHFDVICGGGDDSSIIQLLECVPMVEHLHLDFCYFELNAAGGVLRKLPISLVHLKYLHLSKCILLEQSHYSFALFLIRSSPYLKKIKIEIFDEWDPDMLEEITVFRELQDYWDIKLDHLTELEIEHLVNVRLDCYTELDIERLLSVPPESELLKLILIKSPMLKKVHIKLNYTIESDEENVLQNILRLPRASPLVEIIVEKD